MIVIEREELLYLRSKLVEHHAKQQAQLYHYHLGTSFEFLHPLVHP
jgi:hypothetical protein